MNGSNITFMSWNETLGALALIGGLAAFMNAGGAMRSITEWRRERRRGRVITNVRFY
jgi:hypothetical protein